VTTNIPLSARLQRRIAKELAAGKYRSPEDMMVQALDALADRRGAIEAIARGLTDVKAGRMRSWRDCKRDVLKRKPHLAIE
jgi:predicted transcriptional regulator